MSADSSELGVDSRALIPDACRETRRAVVDMIRGEAPSTVLGLLIAEASPLTIEAIAGLLGRPVEEIEWTVDVLEEEDLCLRISENSRAKVRAFAPYSTRNK